MAAPEKDILDASLANMQSSLDSQMKTLQDARDTQELYRQARLGYDGALRYLTEVEKKADQVNMEAATKARDAALARYQEMADRLKVLRVLFLSFCFFSLFFVVSDSCPEWHLILLSPSLSGQGGVVASISRTVLAEPAD